MSRVFLAGILTAGAIGATPGLAQGPIPPSGMLLVRIYEATSDGRFNPAVDAALSASPRVGEYIQYSGTVLFKVFRVNHYLTNVYKPSPTWHSPTEERSEVFVTRCPSPKNFC